MLRKKYLVKRYGSNRILNVGCGEYRVGVNLDSNEDVKPDVLGDAMQLPFKSGSFDVVFAFDLIEHLINPVQMIRECERVGKNAVITCLDFSKCPENWKNDSTHVYYFDWRIFQRFFSNYNCFKLRNMMVAVKESKPFNKRLFIFYKAIKKLRMVVK